MLIDSTTLPGKEVRLDNLDVQLIRLLSEDGRRSSIELGKELHESPSTIRHRIAKLLENQVIRIAAIINYPQIGFPLTTLIKLNVDHMKMPSVKKFLIELPEVTWVATITGQYDMSIVARFRNTGELADFLENQLGQLEGVRASDTSICLQVWRRFDLPP